MKSFTLLIFALLFFTNCTKKTDIEVKVYNPLLDEYVPNATVIIYEREGNDNVATEITDKNGTAYFNAIKIKKNKNRTYFVSLKEAWGISNPNIYSQNSDEHELYKGESSSVELYDTRPKATFNLKYNNLLNPSQINDSLNVCIKTLSVEFWSHNGNYLIGGDTVFKKSYAYDILNLPYPAILNSNITTCDASRIILTIRKRKMGIVTSSIDSLKVYPNRSNIIEVNW